MEPNRLTAPCLVKAHGKLRMLVEMQDFHGWMAGALSQDIKFDAKHFADIERLAIVGETKWQHGMPVFCKPFTSAKVRYFDRPAIDPAVNAVNAVNVSAPRQFSKPLPTVALSSMQVPP